MMIEVIHMRTSRAARLIAMAGAVAMFAAAPGAGAAPVQRAPGDLSWTSAFGTAVPRTFSSLSAADTHGTFIGAVGSSSSYGPDTDPFWGPPLLERDGIAYGIDATDGHAIWSSTFAGPADTWQSLDTVALSPDGSRMFVAGSEEPKDSNASESSALVLCLDAATGDLLWQQRFGDGSRAFWGSYIDVTPDGATVVVGGSEWENSKPPVVDKTGGSLLTMALDGSTGDVKWHREFQSKVGSPMDRARGMVLSPDGSQVVVTGMGSKRKSWDLDYATIAYAVADGSRSWIAWYDGRYSGFQDTDIPEGIAFDPSGSQVVVTGYSQSERRGYSFATIAYGTTDGQQRWVDRYDGPAPGNTSDIPTGIAFAPDGSQVYVTGSDQEFLSTVAYEPATGDRAWVNVRPYRTGGGEMPDIGLMTDPEDGALLMGGQVVFRYGRGAMALSPVDGAQLWLSSTPPTGRFAYYGSVASSDAVLLFGRQPVRDKINGNSSIPAIASYSTVP